MARQNEILDQMAYLIDELEAQGTVIGLVPAELWDARPPAEPKTLREMYREMLERECGPDRRDLDLDETAVPPVDDPAAILRALAAARADTISGLRPRTLSDDQLAACFRITQRDARSLQAISVRLYETRMGGPRVKSL